MNPKSFSKPKYFGTSKCLLLIVIAKSSKWQWWEFDENHIQISSSIEFIRKVLKFLFLGTSKKSKHNEHQTIF
jgi:hypothetical protein